MTRQLLTVVLLGLVLGACTNRREEAIKKVGHDEEAIKKASGAVNAVIRNSPDCTVAKPLIPEAYQRIEEARGEVSMPAASQTLDALKAQVDRVAEACP